MTFSYQKLSRTQKRTFKVQSQKPKNYTDVFTLVILSLDNRVVTVHRKLIHNKYISKITCTYMLHVLVCFVDFKLI